MKNCLSQAVFLDRDGVINAPVIRAGKPFAPVSREEFQILPGVGQALQILDEAGFLLIIVTNQPDVARGLIHREVVEDMHDYLMTAFPLDDIKACYETEESGSRYYKPHPGMLLDAAKEHGIDLKKSFMVGDRWRDVGSDVTVQHNRDRWRDVGCGLAAGCFTIFIDRGYVERLRQIPHARCGNLQEAVPIILSHSRE